MKSFVTQVFLKYFTITAVVWLSITAFDLFFVHVLKSKEPLLTSQIWIWFASYMSSVVLSATGWLLYWRRAARSIQQFWLVCLLVVTANLGFSALCYLMLGRVFSANAPVFALLNPSGLEAFWLSLLAILLGMAMLTNHKAAMARRALQPGKQMWVTFGVFAWIGVGFSLFAYSPLIACAFFGMSMIAGFLLRNELAIGSLSRPLRLKLIAVGAAVIAACFGMSYKFEYAQVKGQSRLLGALGPQVVWKFEDLEKVKKASEWVKWFAKSKNLNPDQMITAFSKLNALCPAKASDYPITAACIEADADSDRVFVQTKLDKGELEKYLSSSLEYIKIIGLLEARKLKDLPADIRKTIEAMAAQPGNLSPVATTTLQEHGKSPKPTQFTVFVGK